MPLRLPVIIVLFCSLIMSKNVHAQCCTYHLNMHDTYGDGWNGGHLQVTINSNPIGDYFATLYGSVDSFQVCTTDTLRLIYTAGSYEEENSYQLYDPFWNLLFSDGTTPQAGLSFTTEGSCQGVVLPGNNPCNAIPIDTGMCVFTSNAGMPTSGINPGCANFAGGDIWFSMIVPPSGNLSLSTDSGTINDTGLAAWTGSSCATLQGLGCDDDSGVDYYSLLSLNDLTPGATLYIQAFGYGGASGSFNLCVRDLGVVALDSSELPIVMINTLNQIIPNDVKVNCRMDIKYNGFGNITHINDSANIYSGNIGIEVRGATSAGYPQKPYSIETRDSVWANKDVSILGMPAENDWVLLSNYNDRSLIRNALAFKLFGDLGHYSPRARLCEVLIDSSYRGIYLIGEKIKRDPNRVSIGKLTSLETSGDALTGGYILQQNIWDNNNSFQSNFSPIDHPGFDVHFMYEYPDPDSIVPAQKSYIASYIDSLETALYSADFADPVNGYRKYLSTTSFIDYLLVNELSRNADGFKKSVFFNKDQYSRGGKLKAGPVWDFDWAWKNLNGCALYQNTDGSGWAHLNNDCPTDNYGTGYYVRMMQDSTFNNELRCRYEECRRTIFDTANLFHYIDSVRALVHNAQDRHFRKWALLGYSGPAPEMGAIAATYDAELDTMKAWISMRLAWLDENVPGHCIPAGVALASDVRGVLQCYPNPSHGTITFSGDFDGELPMQLTVCDATGRAVERINVYDKKMHLILPMQRQGVFGYRLSDANGILAQGKFINL